MQTPTSPGAVFPIDRALSTGEAARRLGVSPAWVKVLISRGQLAAYRLPSGWAVDARSVESFVARREREAAGDGR